MAITPSAAFKNAAAAGGVSGITYIGLVNAGGTEPTGGSPAYARKAAGTWTSATNAPKLPADLTFDVPAGFTVAGWKGFSATTAGTDYGGGDLTPESYAGQGHLRADGQRHRLHRGVVP